jgi:hypothetical protein
MDSVLIVRSPQAEPLALLGVPGARALGGGALGGGALGGGALGGGSVLVDRQGAGGARRVQRITVVGDVERVVAATSHPTDVLVFDARDGGMPLCLEVLERLFPDGARSGPVLPDRTLALVPAGQGGVEAAFALGRRGVGHVLADPDLPTLLARLDSLLAGRARGRIALEGLLWELGVLRALDACLPDRSLVDLDLFCGISAGSVIGALLANGIGPQEIARALTGQSTRIEPIGRAELFDPDVREVARRLGSMLAEVVRGGVGPRGVFSSLRARCRRRRSPAAASSDGSSDS